MPCTGRTDGGNMEGRDLTEEADFETARRGDGGVYLIVADNSEEFPVVLRYACRLASSNRGHVAILYVMEIDEFQHWGNVESRMRQEMRAEAEKLIWGVAQKANDLNGTVPAIYLEEGTRIDKLTEIINKDMAIRMLILAAAPGVANPGPLVTHFSSKGLSKLRVPVVIVPGHLEPNKIDEIA